MNPNIFLVLGIVMTFIAGLVVWCGPKGCRWLAQILLARAAGLDAYRNAYAGTMRSAVLVIGEVKELGSVIYNQTPYPIEEER